jgi:hypothetical protein
MNKIVISEYFSDDDKRKSVVCLINDRYIIDFYQDGAYNHTTMHGSSSLSQVESMAEDYVLDKACKFSRRK